MPEAAAGPARRAGVFIAVVGASGAGKDSLIRHSRAALCDSAEFVFARRAITRPSDAHEDCDEITPEGFAEAVARGLFALHWQAHGLSYGVPGSVLEELRQGRNVVCNISRGAVGEARRVFARVAVIEVAAPPEIIAARLAARGREAGAGQQARLARGDGGRLAEPPDARIENAGKLDETGQAFLAALRAAAGVA